MPVVRGEKGYLGFVNGLYTEANPLAAPEGTTADELNMELDIGSGTRVRRKGLERSSPVQVDLPQDVFGTVTPEELGYWYWRAENKYVTVYRYEKEEGVFSCIIGISGSDNSFEFSTVVDTAEQIQPTVAEIRNRFVITLGTAPVVLQKTATSYDVYVISLFVRDFTLVNDGLSMSERPSSLGNEHKYNLYNAGWYKERKLSSGSVGDPVTDFFTDKSVYPSNSDIAALGDSVNTSSGEEEFKAETLDNIDLGSTEAPRGHYIFNIRDIERSDKLTDKDNDGSVSTSVTKVVEDGTDTGDGGGSGGSVWDDPMLPDGTILP